MKLFCVIDHLGSGGAQRQLTTLAVFLKRRGHSVCFLTYHHDDFFRPVLDEAGISIETLLSKGKISRPLALRKVLNAAKPDAVLAFLDGPSLYSELAGLPSRKWGLVVSERLQVVEQGLVPDWHRCFHFLADYVTTNSHANRRALVKTLPFLRRKVATIYNCLNLDVFRPVAAQQHSGSPLVRLVVAASYQERKNTLGLVHALSLALKRRPDLPVSIDFYGGLPVLPGGGQDRRYLSRVEQAVSDLRLEGHCRLHGPDANIASLYRAYDAVILPSLLEGLPNAVCEGMACGLPVLASDIGDARLLVRNSVNGFLFDATCLEAMAEVIVRFCLLPSGTRSRMGAASRRIAEELFAPAPVVAAYAQLLEAAVGRRTIQLPHWPAEEREGIAPAGAEPLRQLA